jgi:4-hydroxy-tetrahydrodipicolinate synthase
VTRELPQRIASLQTGIIGVVQTPFDEANRIDYESLDRLVHHALEAGVDGFLAPAIASENAWLSYAEKLAFATCVQHLAADKVPVIWGSGSYDPKECLRVAQQAEQAGAGGLLVAVPPDLYDQQERILPHFQQISSKTKIPLMIQDWRPAGPGMSLETILSLYERVESFRFLKIETVPAGPKYTQVLIATKGNLHVSGGWAVQQMIEALDRGVHAMIPECSMIAIYKRINTLHRGGNRPAARQLFNRLIPVLCFTNQQLDVSIRFFKRLLVRKGIFRTPRVRLTSPEFDTHSERISEELIDLVLTLEAELETAGGTQSFAS